MSSRGTTVFSSFRSTQKSLPNNVSNEEAIFSRASTSAARYVADSNADNTQKLDESLSDVIRYISDAERAARLSITNVHVQELLRYTPPILEATTTNAITRSRFYRLLFNIAHRNVILRRYMAADLELCGPVFYCLKVSLREQLGPQNMIDILRLIQVLSYEKTVTLAIWANELISFLIQEVIRIPEQEWMPYCIAILCNLATRSKSVCNRIKKSSSYKQFSRRIMELLSHDARIIVVSCLVLIGYLEEKVRDMVYCTQNVHETFQCVFNVLIIGDDDCLMTRQIAADLLRRLIVSDIPSISSVPTLATTGKDVLNYGFFNNCIQETANLLITLDPRMEEANKVYDLLLSFCSLQILRPSVCQAIIRCAPTESRLTTPILAISKAAEMTSYEAINPETPLKALKLLAYLLYEIIEPNEKIVPYVPLEHIVSLVNQCINTKIEPNGEDVDISCRRIQLGLRLAEVCSRDEDIRHHLLEVCPAHVCNSIANYQFLQNPVVLYLTKPPLQRTEPLPIWSLSGIAIVLELCRLLAVLKDFSKAHKDQYWKLLKDERLIPFLAYAIAYGDHETVLYAFRTYSHCAQVHAFQTHLLAEMVASCTLERRQKVVVAETSSKTIAPSSAEERADSEPRMEQDERTMKALDDLLRKISIEGCNWKDAKTSEIFAAFERKIALLQMRERDLEALVQTKNEALAQSERLRLQYKNGGSSTHLGSELEISKLRLVMQECEDLREQNQKLTAFLETTKHDTEVKLEALRDELRRSTIESERLRVESQSNQKLIESYTISCDDLKKKLDAAITSANENQQRIMNLETENRNLSSELNFIKSEADRITKSQENDIQKLNSDIALQITRIETFNNENREIKRLYEEKTVECESVREQLVQIEAKCSIREKEIERMSQQISSLDNLIAAKERECQAAAKEIVEFREKLSFKEKESADRLTEVNYLQKELDRTKRELDKLQNLRRAMLSLASSDE